MLQPLHGGLGEGHLTSPAAHRELDASVSAAVMNFLYISKRDRLF